MVHSSSSAIFNGMEWVSVPAIVSVMVSEFGIGKTYVTIQALYDNDQIDQQTAGFLLDTLKAEHCTKKQAAKIVLM
ncbi:hypothetical protein HOT61_gp088 [Salmonella phage S116]|uniref:Uncharacterized protein n=3 Tax=Epseptimavirus TaxID=2732017 RepID=A0A2P0QDH1_9CAUD|nr:hypothetical protein HOT61_gp088 [Salmonella phage S116]ARM69675.1 hypothetical protein BSP22A_0012 [Salmonella phage BSP22A]AXC40700.1 hypothetical protein [Salmonella phage S116]ELI0696293.1 hypothetical protein [Salmonella enterica]QEI25963.1 hypothetical protein [Salmonella phage SE18]